MTQTGNRFAPFFSDLQLARLLRDGPRDSPALESLTGTMLFLDIVGFSRVTESLGEQGTKGAEVLSGVLLSYFEPILATIREHGGDVLFFAGDAVGVLWRASSRDSPGDAAIAAAQCALDIQSVVASVEPPWGEPLRFRVSLGAGDLEALEVGGVRGRWLQIVRGEALERCKESDRVASAGNVIVDAGMRDLLEPAGPELSAVEGGRQLRLTNFRSRVEPQPAPDLDLGSLPDGQLSHSLPESVSWRVRSGGELMAEFRRVSILFVNLAGPGSGAKDPVNLRVLQRAVALAQEHIDRLEGILYQVLEDDKGASLIATFGLPGTSHVDDPMRTVLAGRGIIAAFRELGLEPSGGIATGQVFCGLQGDSLRKRYCVIGSTVNLAARLMTLATDQGQGLLCDGTTRDLVGSGFEFLSAGSTTPKGFAAPIDLFVPGEEVRTEALEASGEIVGRAEQISALGRVLDEVAADGETRAVVIKAEAGMGKSTLVRVAKRLAGERGARYSHGAADSFETGTAYYALRKVTRDWFGIGPDYGRDAAALRLTEAFAESGTDTRLIPLLGNILGFDFPETEFSEQLRGQERATKLHDLVARQANRVSQDAVVLLALEDGHWLDEASWSLLPFLLDRVRRLLLVLTTRPMASPPQELADVLGRTGSDLYALPPFDHASTEDLVRMELLVDEVSEEVVEFVTRRSVGNPFFAQEIVRSIHESGGLRVREGRAEMALANDEGVPLPTTLEGVITSRIDRIEPDVQVTIKVASVLGRSFEGAVLERVHPEGLAPGSMSRHMEALEQASMVEADRSGGYTFTHALTQEAAYNLLPFAQRERLHRSTAETLETMHAGQLEPIAARLGYHFRMGQVPDRAVPYLARAGEAAVDAYASGDAISLLSDALELDEQVRGPVDRDLDRARWCRLIGQAHYNQDEQLVAGDWYRRSVRLAGALPRGRVLGGMGIVGRAVFAPDKFGNPPGRQLEPDERRRKLEGLAAGRELAVVYMWDSSMGKFALNSLNQARVSRMVGPSAESADANATLGFLISASGFHGAGEKLALKAVEMAEAVGDLRQTVSVLTIAGMLLEQNGRAEEGLPYLERCNELAADMETGMYRHRARYMLSDALAVLGRWDEARDSFLLAAEFSRGVEPHTVGMATAMVALSHLRQGRARKALEILEGPDGVRSVLEGGVGISIVIGLGVLAETRLALGDPEAAMEAVLKAESLTSGGDDGTAFYSSIFGHSAVGSVRLALDEPGAPVRVGRRRRTPLQVALGRVAKIKRTAPGAGAWLALLRGLDEHRRGNMGGARTRFEAAVERAEAAAQPYELGRSLAALAGLSADPDRRELLDRAVGVFEHHGMVPNLDFGKTPLSLD